jgi:hypothetical protein
MRSRRGGQPAAALLLLLLSVQLWSAARGHPPFDLSNFQNEFACDPAGTVIVRPRTPDDVVQAVKVCVCTRVRALLQGLTPWLSCLPATPGARPHRGHRRGPFLEPGEHTLRRPQLAASEA